MIWIKNIIKSLKFYKPLLRLYRIMKKIPTHPLQIVQEVDGYKYSELGSNYGGWSFVEEDGIHGCTIISAGLGEDASFDIEFASKYNAKVIIVDPTPRAIDHFNSIKSSFGNKKLTNYVNGGKQPIASYDLSKVNKDNFKLISRALWNEDGELKFYEPPNPSHVSYSAINFQNNYSQKTNYINVKAITFDKLLDEINLEISDIYLVKLDIEGAQLEVISQFLNLEIYPKQILVELDELNLPSKESFERVDSINTILSRNGYSLLKSDGHANFLFYKKSVDQ